MAKYDYPPISADIGHFEDLEDLIFQLPLKYQKHLAENILTRLEENHYTCTWVPETVTLVARKVEEL